MSAKSRKYTAVPKAKKMTETMHIGGAVVHLTRGWDCTLACGHRFFCPVGERGDAPLRKVCKECAGKVKP